MDYDKTSGKVDDALEAVFHGIYRRDPSAPPEDNPHFIRHVTNEKDPQPKPPLSVYRLTPSGKDQLAVRWFSSAEEARNIFSILKRMAERKSALLEMPFAKIQGVRGKTLLVTLWRRKTRSMWEYLHDESITDEQRMFTVRSALKKIAKLHAQGILHGHIKETNIQVANTGEALLIDPTQMVDVGREIPWSGFGQNRQEDFKWNDAEKKPYNFFKNLSLFLIRRSSFGPEFGNEFYTRKILVEQFLERIYHEEYEKALKKEKSKKSN